MLLSFIEIVESPSSPSSSPSSLPFVSSVPFAAFEKPIEELTSDEVTRALVNADEVAVVDDSSEVAMEVGIEVGDTRVSRSIVEALVSLA